MSANTSIQWTDRTWNPVRGCSRVSPGCDNCYAMGIAYRFSGAGRPYEGLALRRGPDAKRPGVDWTGKVRLVPDALDEPLSWRKPCRVFVNSMSDLFHDGLSDEQIDRVFGVMWACLYIGRLAVPGHTFQILTKRAKRMCDYVSQDRRKQHAAAAVSVGGGIDPDGIHDQVIFHKGPHPRIWLGVSTEDQQRADERIPLLLETPAAVRFVSVEPMLGPVDLFRCYTCGGSGSSKGGSMRCPDCVGHPGRYYGGVDVSGAPVPRIDWAIFGGESGRNARPLDVRWIRDGVRQCREAGVAAFVKQLGANVRDRNDAGFLGEDGDAWDIQCLDDVEHDPDGIRNDYQGAPVRVRLRDSHGGDMSEWPSDLRVREFPS